MHPRVGRLLAFGLGLSACSRVDETGTGNIDIGDAASQAQANIDNYGAARNVVDANAVRAAPRTGRTAARPAIPLPPSVSAEPTAREAAEVARRYYAFVAAARYEDAWALWEGADEAPRPGEAFAADFKAYSEYRATIGVPSRIDAGAGQRYVTVPVTIVARLRDGGARIVLSGEVTLHHVADIPGASPEARRWRIRSVEVEPELGEGEDAIPAVANATYRCADRTTVAVRFDNRAGTAVLRSGGRLLATIPGQRPASGIWYAGDGYELRGKGADATLKRPARREKRCTART